MARESDGCGSLPDCMDAMTILTLPIKKTPHWARTLIQETTRPVFSVLPKRWRPYVLSLSLFAVAGIMMTLDHAAPMQYGLPWSLVAILVVVASANFWGPRPALVVLVACSVYEGFVPQYFIRRPDASDAMLCLRTLLFTACGAAVIWLTHRARQMQERVEIKHQVLAAMQSMILPDALPPVAGYDIGPVYRPARHEEEVGGDFYDVFPIDGGARYAILIGDVMGKGKEAASSTALLRYTVRAFSGTLESPARVVERMNDLIELQNVAFATATLFLGFLDTACGTLLYCNAGHEPPMLRRAGSGERELLMPTASVIGVGSGIACDDETTTLLPDDALFLFTDGVTESRNRDGAFLGDHGAWRMLLAALPAPTAGMALATLDDSLQRYAEGDARDDVTMLLVRRDGCG